MQAAAGGFVSSAVSLGNKCTGRYGLWSQVLSQGVGVPMVCGLGSFSGEEGYPSQILGQLPTPTPLGQDQDSPPGYNTIRYASCGHVGGLSFYLSMFLFSGASIKVTVQDVQKNSRKSDDPG